MATEYTIDQVREAKAVLENELTHVIQARLCMFTATTGIRVEQVDAQFIAVQKLGSRVAVPVFQRVEVKLEDI